MKACCRFLSRRRSAEQSRKKGVYQAGDPDEGAHRSWPSAPRRETHRADQGIPSRSRLDAGEDHHLRTAGRLTPRVLRTQRTAARLRRRVLGDGGPRRLRALTPFGIAPDEDDEPIFRGREIQLVTPPETTRGPAV